MSIRLYETPAQAHGQMGAGESFQTWVRDGVGIAAAPPGSGMGWGPWRLHLGQGRSGDLGGSTWVRERVGTAEAPPGSGKEWGPPGLSLGTAEAQPGAGSRWGLLWLCGPSHTDAAQAAALTTQLWEQAEDA